MNEDSIKPKKNHDPLDDLLDRPIAYNPAFKRITGSTVSAIFLSQGWYWSKIHKADDGWFYKTQKEWEDETGLTRSEQETARKHCHEKGVMEEKLKGVPATLYYRVNKKKVYELLGFQFAGFPQTEIAGKSQTRKRKHRKQVRRVPANINKEPENPPETSPETPRVGSLEWDLFHGKEISQEALNHAKEIEEAPKMFETSFGFGKLPWGSNSSWNKLQKFITEIYIQDRLAFGNYVIWRAGDGKYKAMSNKQIRMNPQIFMDTGWMEFLADKNPAPIQSKPQLSEEEIARKRAIAAQLVGR